MEKEMKKKKLKTKWLVVLLSGLLVLFAASGLILHFVLNGEEEPVVEHNEEQEDEVQEEVVQTPGHVDITWYDDKETDFTITTIQQLNGLSLLAMTYDFEGKNIKLGADITLNEGNAAEWNKKEPDYFYTPIGKMEKPFKGNFDGQGHTISGLYCLREHTVALFAFTQGSTIKNIRLVNSYFETTGLPVATKDLIGFTASIVGRSVGGTIENCYSDAQLVSVGMYNGGICAEVLNQTGNVIRNCWFDGTMNLSIQEGQKDFHVAGGILGAVSDDVVIENCLNSGEINATGSMIGGLIGWTAPGQTTEIRDTMNVGKVATTLKSCWFQSSTVSYAKHLSIVKLENVYTITEGNIYSNVRSDRATVEGAPSVFPLAKIKGIDAYKRTALDFDNYWVAIKESTPELKIFSKGISLATKGVAKAADYIDTSWYKAGKKSFTLKTIQQLNGLAYLTKSNDFKGVTIKLGADITMNKGNAADWAKTAPEAVWAPIGEISAQFNGTFDGQGHTISGIYSVGEQQVGIFGWVGKDSVLKNFKVTNSYFECNGRVVASDNNKIYALVGSVAGVASGTIENIYSDAIVKGIGSFGGGLIGRITNYEATVKNCQFAGSVKMYNATAGAANKAEYVGGLIGAVDAKTMMQSCNFTGSVWSESGNMMGGFAGRAQGVALTLRGCLSTGTVQKDGTVVYMTSMGVGYINTTGSLDVKDTYILYTGTTSAQYRKEEKTKFTGYFTQRNAVEDYMGVGTKATGLLGYDEWIITEELPELKAFSDKKPIVDISWYDEQKAEYELNTIEDFCGFMILGQSNTFEGKEILLKTDIEFNEGNAADWKAEDPKNQWQTIGSISSQFAGTFDGQGHTISGIYAKGEQQVGLFGWTAKDSTIKNFKLVNSYFEADGRVVASDNNNIYALVGSVAGVASGTIESIYSDAIVEGNGFFGGGLIGRITNYEATMKNCQFSGSVKMYNANAGAANKAQFVGGLVGAVDAKTMMQSCNFTGSIWSESGNMMGGFSGRAQGVELSLYGCLSTGTVQKDGTVAYMTSLGVGYINTTGKLNVTHTYILYTGTTSAHYRKETATVLNGGFVCCNSLEEYQGLTTKATGLFQYPEWILTKELPELKAFTEAEAIVDTSWYFDTEDSKYKLANMKDVYGFALLSQYQNFAGKEIVLDTDILLDEKIDPAEKIWISIGSSSCPFAGNFDGKEHKISGLSQGVYGQSTYVGVFAMINGGTVQNLKIENSSFTGQHQVGALAGVANNAIVKNVDITATVKAKGGHVGGFFGRHLQGTLTMTDCHMLGGSVTSDSTIAGGFIGTNDGVKTTLTDCTNVAAISAAGTGDSETTGSQAGGFIGRLQGSGTTEIVRGTNKGVIRGSKGIVGGLVGLFESGGTLKIHNSNNEGSVTSSTTMVAGFIGFSKGAAEILDSKNKAAVTGINVVGGFVGRGNGNLTIQRCKNESVVSSSANGNSVGGFIGWLVAGTVNIVDCENKGNITAKEWVGGFVGQNQNDLLTISASTNSGTITITNHSGGGFVGGTWKKLAIQNCVNKGTINGNTGNTIGGFIGYIRTKCNATTTISGSRNEGAISGTSANAGGFVGQAASAIEIKNSTNTASISSNQALVAGLIANACDKVVLENCSNAGNITGTQQIGGLIGRVIKDTNTNQNASTNATLSLTITKCKNSGTVTGTLYHTGGFVGFTQNLVSARITESENSGKVINLNSGTGSNFGGFVGWNQNAPFTFQYCINKGVIQSDDNNAGGFIGTSEGTGAITMDECLNVGKVTGGTQNGAFVGNTKCAITLTDCYASLESNANVYFMNYNGTVKWHKDAAIQLSEANLKGVAAKTNAANLEWDTKWLTSDGFPKLKCFEPVATQTKLSAQKVTFVQKIVNVLKSIF